MAVAVREVVRVDRPAPTTNGLVRIHAMGHLPSFSFDAVGGSATC
jgi:hypothetical protein